MAIPGDVSHPGINIDFLFSIVNDATLEVKKKLALMKGQGSEVSITDMFHMQMLMNHLAQLSEMSTSVVSASNGAIASMARNVK